MWIGITRKTYTNSLDEEQEWYELADMDAED